MKSILAILLTLFIQINLFGSVDTIPGRSLTKRLIVIDIDSIENTPMTYRLIFKSLNNKMTICEYTINATRKNTFFPNMSEHVGVIKFNIKVVDTDKTTEFKDFETMQINNEIIEATKIVEELNKRKDNVKKIN